MVSQNALHHGLISLLGEFSRYVGSLKSSATWITQVFALNFCSPTAVMNPASMTGSKSLLPFLMGPADRDEYRKTLADLLVDIRDPSRLNAMEIQALNKRLRCTNMVIYRCAAPENVTREHVSKLANQMGLGRPDRNLLAAKDGLSEVEVKDEARFAHYIPYTNRPLNWHSDGYYQSDQRIIRSMLLHCAYPAERGGELTAIDHRVLFSLLAELDIRFPEALSRTDAMTIPAHYEDGASRSASQGPVFFFEQNTLRMRYTARKHNVIWASDVLFQEALSALQELFEQSTDFQYTRRLKSGEGILCANVPHRRESFEDGTDQKPKRLMYRGRFREALNLG